MFSTRTSNFAPLLLNCDTAMDKTCFTAVWHSLKRLGILRRMRGRRGGQRLNNNRIKPIESAYRALGTNSNFMRDYSKNSVATSNVCLGPPSAACL